MGLSQDLRPEDVEDPGEGRVSSSLLQNYCLKSRAHQEGRKVLFSLLPLDQMSYPLHLDNTLTGKETPRATCGGR